MIFAEPATELQAALNAMYLYCKPWDLEINQTKTKITIFANRKLQQNPVFTYNGEHLDIDNDFVYLGAQFSYNGRFQRHDQRLVDKASKPLFAVLRKQENCIYL